MSEEVAHKVTRDEVYARIKAACKANDIDQDSVPRTWQDEAAKGVPVIPTPSSRLNACLGVGGIPQGRIIEIFGTEMSGKTTLMLQIMAKAQQMGMVCNYVDMEHALDASYAEALGVNMEEVLISQPTDGNTAMQLLKIAAESGCGLAVLDSIPALVSREELDKSITDSNVAHIARTLSQGLRQLTPIARRTNCTIVFINQLREKIGVMYGNPETTPGGRAMKYYASVRIDMRALGGAKRDDDRRTSKIHVVKNKLASPFRHCEVDIVYGKGFDKASDTFEYARELNIITGRGFMKMPWLECEGLKASTEETFQVRGKDKAIEFINSTPGYLEALMSECHRVLKEGPKNETVDED